MAKRRLTPEEKRIRRQKFIKIRKSRVYKNTAIIFLAVIVLVDVCGLIQKDKTFSERENRILAGKPEFSKVNLLSGKYMTDAESYITDQFVLRDQWISFKLGEDRLLGKRESNGVYIGKKQYLMETLDTPDEEAVDKSCEAIRAFADRHNDLNICMALVPNAAYICQQYLPKHAPVRDQGQDIKDIQKSIGSGVSYVDVAAALTKHKDQPIYYKTDHHWTSLGAFYALQGMTDKLGIEKIGSDAFAVYPVTTDFQGTLSSKSGATKAKDTIEIYAPANGEQVVVTYVDDNRKSASVFDSAALDTKDKYEVFFGGNHTRIDIATAKREGKNLLVLKDSYANCFVPMLINYYKNIIVVDPRYYYDDLDKLIRDNDITDVLFLYNVNTFVTDKSLADVLAEQSTDEATEEGTQAETEAGTEAGTESGTEDGAESGTESGTENGSESQAGAETGTETETTTQTEAN